MKNKLGYAVISVTALACNPSTENRRSHAPEAANSGADAKPIDDSLYSAMPEGFFSPSVADSSKGICPTGARQADLSASMPQHRLSNAYLNNCSGCHGTAGEGRDTFPVLQGFESSQRYIDKVRQGGERMPLFGPDLISDEELTQDFALLNSGDKLSAFDSENVPVEPGATLDQQDFVDTMYRGLIAWRTPGERGACVACHGPDGADLARLAYPNGAILRRALGQGLPRDRAMAIVLMIKAMRGRYAIKSACTVGGFAPLQPGGRMIIEGSSEAKDRALLASLQALGIDLSSPAADQAAAETIIAKIAALDVKQVPIAIALNRWTEDAFHGDAHRSTAEWLPEIPMESQSPDDAREWVDLQNSYIRDPSDRNLWALIDGVSVLSGARFTRGGVSERMAREKYKAVLLYQHQLRHDNPDFPDLTKTSDVDRFSVWEIGQIANVMARGCGEAGDSSDPYPCWKYPASFFKKMGTDRDRLLEDVLRMNLPWLVAGWLEDPALQLTEGGDAQILHVHQASERHFEKFRTDDSASHLPLHNVYFSAVRLVKSVEASDEPLPKGRRLGKRVILSCWNIVGPGLAQWIDDTLPAVARMLEKDDDRRSMVLGAISSVHHAVLLKIKARRDQPIAACEPRGEPLMTLKDALTKIGAWHKSMDYDVEGIQNLAKAISLP